MKTILFTDLDDTLFVSARKQPPTAEYVLATTLDDGSPSAYLSPSQQQFLQLWQNEQTIVIPVTARNSAAFKRVHLPFCHVAVINHGGTILNSDNRPDEVWHDKQRRLAAETADWLAVQAHRLNSIAATQGSAIRLRINCEYGLDLYVLLKSAQQDDAAVARIAAEYQARYADPTCGYLHCNGNNLAILPYWLNKAAAVTYLIEQLRAQYGEILTIGCGDSNSDLPFMRCCAYQITPSGSQIDRTHPGTGNY